jgi:cell division protein FtsN
LLATVQRQFVRDVEWHRVYLGPFASHDDAVRLANHLRDQGTITYYKVLRLGTDEGS